MSLASWIEEFSPTPTRHNMPDIEAVDHSLRKWRGVTEKNLARHGLSRQGTRIFEPSKVHSSEPLVYFTFSVETCALCNNIVYWEAHNCGACARSPVAGEDYLASLMRQGQGTMARTKFGQMEGRLNPCWICWRKLWRW